MPVRKSPVQNGNGARAPAGGAEGPAASARWSRRDLPPLSAEMADEPHQLPPLAPPRTTPMRPPAGHRGSIWTPPGSRASSVQDSPPKTLARDHRRQEEPASADESVASTAASRQGPSGVGRGLQVDVPEDGRHGDETSPNRPHSGWFTAREHEVIKGVFEGPFVCDRNTQTMEPSGMRALMMKFRVPRIPGVWQLNEAFNAEHAGEVSAPKTAVMAGFQMVETQSAVGWSFEVFLEHMGLAKLAAENQGSDKTNHSVLRELFQSLDFHDDDADPLVSTPHQRAVSHVSHVAHMISHSWDAATNLLPHHSHKEGDEAGKSKARPTGDGELSPDEVLHFVNLACLDPPITIEACHAMLSMVAVTSTDDTMLTDTDNDSLTVEGFVDLMSRFSEQSFLNEHTQRYAQEIENWRTFMTVLDVLHFLTAFGETVTLEHHAMSSGANEGAELHGKRCFWSPDHTGRTMWDVLMFPLLGYIVIVIPLRIGFDISEPVGTSLWWVDVFTDVYFAFDIILNFRTAIMDEHGHLIIDNATIACSYLKGWFLIDFVSVLPIQYAMLIINANNPADEGDSVSSIKIAKILRLVRLAKNVARLGRIKKLQELWTKYEDYLEPILTGLSLGKLAFLLLVLGHLMACVWYYVSEDEVRDDNFLVRGWVHREEWGDTVSTWSRYVSSYVYTLSDFVPEIAYTETEKLTSLLLHLMYETFFGFLVGTMATIVMAGQASAQKKDEKIQAVREITTTAGVPLRKKKIIRGFYDTMYKHKTIFDEREMIEELPESARKIMVDGIGESFKTNYQLFLGCDEEVVVKLFLAMRRMRFLANIEIVAKGDVAREVYFLIHGNVHVCLHSGHCDGDDDTEVEGEADSLHWTVPPFGMFGEIEMLEMIKKANGKTDPLLIHLRRRRTVRTVLVSDVGFIFYKDMIPLMSDYPDLDYRLRRQSRLRVMNEQRRRHKVGGELDNDTDHKLPPKIFKDPPMTERMKKIENNVVALNKAVEAQRQRLDSRLDELLEAVMAPVSIEAAM